jgi:serine/threonine-protein phosphatase CPPED1
MHVRRSRAALLVVLLLMLAVSAQAETRFYFAQLTDTHFGEGANAARAEKVVAAINALPVPLACVVHTGDIMSGNITEAGPVQEAQRVLSALRAPVHYIAGNHDVLADALAATRAAFEEHFGPLATKAEYHGVVFLMLYTEPLAGGFTVPGYDPLAWLEQALREAGRKPVIIFQHAPAVEDFYGNAFHPAWPPTAQARWEQLITSHNVKAVIAGHFHRDEFHWIGRTPLFVASPVADLFGREPSYRLYEYRDGRVEYRAQYVK